MSKRIKGITIELDGDTKGLDKALSDVNKTSRGLSKELRDVEKLLKFSPGNAELVAQKQKLLADSVENTRDKLTRLKEAQADVDKQFAEGKINEEQYRAFQREIVETESKLKNLETKLADSTSKLKALGDSAIETGDKLKKVGDKTTEIGKNLSTKVTAPLAGIGAVAAKVGSDFEAGMSKVQAISGASGDDLTKLTEKARQMGATTQFSATEAAQGLSYMAMAGWKTEEMLSGIEGVMALAAASGEDLALTSDIVTDALTAFGMTAADSGKFADVLATASSNANTNVAMLGESFKYVAPVAGALKFSAEDTALALGLMANSGIKASNAGTALRSMMTNLTEVSKPVAKEMARLGLSLTDNEGNMKSFRTIMDDLRVTYRDMTPDLQANSAAQLFGKEAMSGALAIINASEADYLKLAEAINTSEGAAQQMAETMTDNLQGRMKEMQSALEEAAISIYDNLQPALESLVGFVQKLADWFNELSPATQTTIVVLAGLAAAVGPILVIAGMLISSLGALFTAFGTISGAIAVVTAGATAATPAVTALAGVFTFITGPIGIAIAAITAIIAVGVLLYRNWDTIKEEATQIWGAIKTFLSSTLDSISKKVETVMQAIKVVIDKAWNTIEKAWMAVLKAIATALGLDFDKMKNSIQTVMDTIKQTIDTVWNYIRETFQNVIGFIKALVSGDFEGMKNAVKNQMNLIKETIGFIWDDVKAIFTNSIDAVKRALSSGFETAVDIVLGFGQRFYDAGANIVGMIADGIKSAISKVTDAIGNVVGKVRDFLPFSPAKTGPLKDIDKLNFGGPIGDSIKKAIPGVQAMMNAMLTMPDVNSKALSQSVTSTTHAPVEYHIHNLTIDGRTVEVMKHAEEFFTNIKREVRAK